MTTKQLSAAPADWLPILGNGGMMGAQMRAHDWSRSPLGHPRDWSPTLLATVGLMLNSKFPMFIAWGDALGFLYNDSYVAIMGDKHPGALGKRFHEVWPEIWDDIHPLIARALAGEATYIDRLPLRMRRHGYLEDTWFRFSYSPLRDEHGVVAGMFCACVDMTVDVLAQRSSDDENARLVALFEEAPGIIAVLRPRPRVRTDQPLVPGAGRPPGAGRQAGARGAARSAGPGYFELLDEVYRSGQPFVGHAVPLRVQREPGAPLDERFIDFVYQPIHDQHGKVTGIFVEGSDVTARKRVEDELRAADHQKDQFLAMLAHELRNPLAPITTAAQLLRRGDMDAACIARASAIIARQALHMTALVNDLLDVSRVTRGQVTLTREPLEVGALVHEAIEQVRPLLDARGHHLACAAEAGALYVEGDCTRLIQVVSNILNNAAKYTPAGGQVDVAVTQQDGQVHIAVRDNGQGIEPAMAPYLFDLFSQADRTPDRSQGGLGLGLALVKSLVQLHGGRVDAHSAGLGKGSEFVVALPAAAAPVAAPAPHAPEAMGTAGMRVLVVDDNVDAAQMLGTLLEMHGYEVHIAYDGKGALAQALALPPDVALLDIGLPDIDGHELARRLRAQPATPHAMLVALTGYGQPDDQKRALDAGFDHHMVKPADLPKLLDLLATRAPGLLAQH